MTVLVADDHPLYREGVARAIKLRPDLELIGECGDGRSALKAVRELAPDVAVLDYRLPFLTGPQVTAGLIHDESPTRVLLLSAFTESALVYEAVAAGARGYVSKDAGRQTICDAIAAVARGQTVLSTDVQGGLAAQVRANARPSRPRLSARERQILALTSEGHSAPDIARQLFLAVGTVKSHHQHIYDKLGVSDRAAAVAKAFREGILD